MEKQIIFLCALTALLDLDIAFVGQFFISRPTVVGAVIGILCGNFLAGALLGLWAELVLVDHIMIGGHIAPNRVFFASSSVIFFSFFKMPIPVAFISGFAIAWGGVYVDAFMRKTRSSWGRKIEKEAKDNPYRINSWIFKSVVQQFFLMLAYFGVGLFAVGNIAGGLWKHAPVALEKGLWFAFFMIPWLGLGTLLKHIRSR
jgi:mannose/fructose/N-acetylgalactosamine-specific phosphotransferase system component IIC